MTGLPAARQTDMTKHGGPITQGSLTVHIGSSGGVACSTCPGGVSVGNPVNPMLGAKVQSGEVDLALPGPLPFVLSRDYSSYQTDTPAPVGLLGPGWWLPTEVTLLQTADTLTLNDSKGRSIRFDPLAPGQAAYSRSENLWIVRGGQERLDLNKELPVSRLNLAWMGLHEGDRRNPSLFFVTNNLLGPWWVLGTTAPADQVTGRRLQLFGINDRFGRSLRLKRSAEGHVVAVQDGVGRQYRLELKTLAGFATESSGGWGADCGVRLMAVYLTHDPHEPDLPHHPLVRYEYSPRGELIAVYGRGGNRNRAFQYHPKLLGRMVAHAYEGRPPVLYVYNETGKVIEQQRQGALSYRFDYAEDSTTVTDSLGRKTTYHFEGQAGLRRVVKLEHPDGSVTQSRFDASGRLTASIDALGRETRYDLDVATGHILGITSPDGLQTRWDYNTHGQVVHVANPGGASERMQYDSLGRPCASIDALGHITRYQYTNEQSEEPSAVEDARGGTKHLTWSAAGLLTSYTDCSGSTTRYRHDRWGQLLETTGEEGTRSTSQYDSQGRLVARTNALGQTTSYAYNAAGDLTGITGADGSSVRLDRDVQGQLTRYHYGGHTLQFEYDAAVRLVRLTNENGAHTTFEYDAMDRLALQVNFDGRRQSWDYNAAGEVIESHDQGLISRYIHDKGSRLIERQTSLEDRLTEIQREYFTYNGSGQLAKAWHDTELGGNTVTVEFVRDSAGRIIQEIQTITGPQGQEVWRYTVERAFNELGTESQTIYAGLPAINWQTYGSGHLHGMVLDGKALIDFERDKLHRETSRKFGSSQTERSWDTLSRLKHLHTHSPLIGQDQALHRQYHYDAAGQLIRIDTPLGVYQYGYDKAWRLITASQPGQDEQRYRFDPAGNRLFESQTPKTANDNWEETVRQHMQDKSFNLLGHSSAQKENGGQPRWMDNRIKDDGEFYYEYDGWGNLTRKYKAEGNEQHHFYYDSNHRLVRYALESDVAVRGANYHYDVFGRRLAKQVQQADHDGGLVGDIQTTFYGWDGDRLVLTQQGEQQIHTLYEPGSFVPLVRIEKDTQPPAQTLAHKLGLQYLQQGNTSIELDKKTRSLFDGLEQELRDNRLSEHSMQWMRQAQIEPESLRALLDETPPSTTQLVHLYQCDHLGTPQALINTQGQVDWLIQTDAWGKGGQEYNPKQLHQPIRLPGQHLDEESGLHYNRYRYYQQELGRYVTQDPIGLIGGINYYKYPLNPNEGFDPLGLQDWGSIPIFNGNLPGNQAALSTAMAGGPAVSTGGFLGAMGDKIMQGGQIGPSVGGTAVAGIGISASTGTTTDQTGLTCVTSTVCGIIGPMIGGFSSVGYAAQTGKVTPGDVGWSIGGVGAATVGPGGKAELSIGTDGAIGVQGGGTLGGALGGAIQVCRQVTTKTCTTTNK